MSGTIIFLWIFLLTSFLACLDTIQETDQFSFYGSLKLEGELDVNSDNQVSVRNSSLQNAGSAFYSKPLRFKNSSNSSAFSFSTTFVFAVMFHDPNGGGLAFVISPSKDIRGSLDSTNLGPFDYQDGGNSSRANVIAVEINRVLDTLMLGSGDPVQAWIEYNNSDHRVKVTLHSIYLPKPELPLLILNQDVSAYMYEHMYVGFASFTRTPSVSLYILGWNFRMNGEVEEIEISRLPNLPNNKEANGNKERTVLAVILSLVGAIIVLALIKGFLVVSRKKRQDDQVLESWEVQYGPHRFTYKDLFSATKGFKDKELLGKGGFGRVYRGLLPASGIQIAVKRVSHDSNQGMREFLAEIATIGRLRHPNLVSLLGYCRRRQELFLVYEYMPNGSLDKFLYHKRHDTTLTLDWRMRYKIIKDVAAALLYLHQQWSQVVIHRDIKASNVLIDGEMNGRLGDFGLAKLIDHGTDPQTSNVAGTLGYIAPELVRSGKASTSTDIFAFGAFMLEVVCGRRPVEPRAPLEETILVDWVNSCWDQGKILYSVDPRVVEGVHEAAEVELVLKLGLLCSHPVAEARPTISSVLQYLDGVVPLPDNLADIVGTREIIVSNPKDDSLSTSSMAFSDTLLVEGR